MDFGFNSLDGDFFTIAGGDLNIQCVALCGAVHVGVVDDESDGVIKFETSDGFRFEYASFVGFFVVEERGSDGGSVKCDGQAFAVFSAAWCG